MLLSIDVLRSLSLFDVVPKIVFYCYMYLLDERVPLTYMHMYCTCAVCV